MPRTYSNLISSYESDNSETSTIVNQLHQMKGKMDSHSDDQIASQTNLEDGQFFAGSKDIEANKHLKNEERLFSWMFSKDVPPIPTDEERESYPEIRCNIFSRMMFLWLYPILYKGYKRTLVPQDLYYLQDEIKVKTMHARFQKHLDRLLLKAKNEYLETNSNLEDFTWPKYTLIWASFYTFQWQYLRSCFFLALSFGCQSTSPLLTRALIQFVEDRYWGLETTYNKGIGYTFGAIGLILLNGFFVNQFFYTAMLTGAQIKAVLTKALLL